MFEMDENRLDFTDQLAPEEGYSLVGCIGTTYSLDMRALVGTCMSLSGGIYRSSSLRDNYVGAFASIEKLQGKVAIFCEKGRIVYENQTDKLGILLEPLINQVIVRQPNNAGSTIASFHPKVWILDFVRDKDKVHLYRLIVASRNLTLSGSWDVAVRLDGRDTGKPAPESERVVSFIKYLREFYADRKAHDLLARMADAIRNVKFDIDSNYFDSYEFLPFGPKNSGLLDAGKVPLFTDSFTKAIVISPFLSNEGPLERLADNRVGGESASDYHLFSREAELMNLNPSLRNKYTCYVPKSWLADVSLENDGPDTLNAADYSDLHAKLYLTERYSDRNLYLGSLNASRNGMENNIEALLGLKLRKGKGKITSEKVLNALSGDKKPFERFDTSEAVPDGLTAEETDHQRRLDRCFYAAAKLFIFDSVDITENQASYKLNVAYSLQRYMNFEPNLVLSLAPYLASKKSLALESPRDIGVSDNIVFDNLFASQTSELFVLQGSSEIDSYKNSCILRCPDSVFHCPEERDERVRHVLDSILKDHAEALSSYISLAFGVMPVITSHPINRAGSRSTDQARGYFGSGIYESLLRSLSKAPDAQAQLDFAKRMVSYLPEDTRLSPIRNLIDQFERAVRRHG